MKCPHCKTPDLRPTLIEEYLPAMGCDSCHGSLVSLLHYRYWAETQKPDTSAVPPPSKVEVETTETVGAVTCPKCSRIMMKYKLTGRISNRIDVCTVCDDAWLDGGEWELLEALHLSHRIPAILTDQWQRRIRSEQSEELRRSILVRAVGESGLARIEEFKRWLLQVPNRSEIMAFLLRK